jgi:hypothetical protein
MRSMLSFTLNGRRIDVNVDLDTPLLRILYDQGIGPSTAKERCATGTCGDCAVHINGKAVQACTLAAGAAAGREITTVGPPRRPDVDFKLSVLPHLNAAYNLASWLVGNAIEAEDVVQDAFCRALLYFHSFRGTSARAWLLQIVRNAAYASLKRKTEEPLDTLAAEADGDGSDEWTARDLHRNRKRRSSWRIRLRRRCL